MLVVEIWDGLGLVRLSKFRDASFGATGEDEGWSAWEEEGIY